MLGVTSKYVNICLIQCARFIAPFSLFSTPSSLGLPDVTRRHYQRFSTLCISSFKTIFTPDWSCLMLVQKAHVENWRFPAEKQKETKKGWGGAWTSIQSHPTLIQTHQFTSFQTPTHSYNHPSIHSPPHTHTPSHHTPTHPHTQPQDSIHMHMHRLLVPYIQAVRVICFEFMSPKLFPLFSGLWRQPRLLIFSIAVRLRSANEWPLPLKCFATKVFLLVLMSDLWW